MNDKLGPINDFVAEFKTKIRMTQAEEIELFQTLECVSRDVEPGRLQDFVIGVRDKILDSRGNKGIEKGIDLAEVRKAAMRTSTEFKEEKRRREENNRKSDGKIESFTDISQGNQMPSEDILTAEFNIAIDNYISSSFPDLAPVAREAIKARIKSGKLMKDEFTRECEDCKKTGKEAPSIKEFFERKSKKINVPEETLRANWLTELGFRVSINHHRTPKDFVEFIKEDPLLVETEPQKLKALEKAASISDSQTPEEFRKNYYKELGETPPPTKRSEYSWSDFCNETFVIPAREAELAKKESAFENARDEIRQHFEARDDSELSGLLIDQAQKLREINIIKMEIASLRGEKNPVISEELRKAIIDEYMKGEMPVAKVFEKFRKEGIIKGAEVTSYDFIDVVAQELESKNMSEETCKKFIANEEKIAEELYEMEAREIIRCNTEKSGMAAEEHAKNIENMRTLRKTIDVRSQYSTRFAEILRAKQNVKGKETKRQILGFSLKKFFRKDIEAFEDIALMSTINTKNGITFIDDLTEKKAGIFDFLAKLRKSKTTTQEVDAERKDIVPLASKEQNRTVSNTVENSTNPIQVGEIYTGDQQEASREDSTDDRDM